MVYATTTDLEEYLDPLPVDAELMLTRASRVIARAIRAAAYHVDADGQPTDQAVLDALREATCEQVAAWVGGMEDGTGSVGQYGNVSIGSVSLGNRTGGGVGGQSMVEALAPQAYLVLDQAGLLRGSLWSW